ncbi:MAG: biotin--[acetyl-CoA-carboxylase] ligase [Bacteroidetes bacterium]|jgi:BirA family biotin operon repressor/biotin-[acetyl-CoA-carboxylase] ligase|nr:biotin--[acetyl-CoA-carboxylase] ligase [Bacteroidota bacterium]
MKIIQVDSTTSTNTLAKVLNKNMKEKSFCVSAEFQTEGRGQLNSKWQSSRSENLMFTVVFNDLDLEIENQFVLNAMVCLRILKVLKSNNIPNIRFKWPNDILSEQFKICGILIENTLNKNLIKSSYVGIGLNVNQSYFENLPQASSLKNIIQKSVDRHQLLQALIEELETIPEALKTYSPQHIINTYKQNLYNFERDSIFTLASGESHTGKITDVQLDGKLCVEFKSRKQSYFNHKEISQQY